MLDDFHPYQTLLSPGKRIWFIGVGGISMSGLAELALARGQKVGGSDNHPNDLCDKLSSLGAEIAPCQEGENIRRFRPDAVVFSAAIPADNPELLAAREAGIPTLERADWLGLLNREFPAVINVAGTNGKSTTVSMLSSICLDAGLDPTIHLGAELQRFGSTVHAGGSQLMISEACEFNYSFLSFYSTIAAVLNLGHDHVDIFPEMHDVIDAFARFLARLQPGAKVVLPSFDPHMPELLRLWDEKAPGLRGQVEIFTFGYPDDRLLDKAPDLCCERLTYKAGLPQFELSFQGKPLGEFSLLIPGRFNVENAMAALLLAHLAGVDFAHGRSSLAAFEGAEGRFTVCGEYRKAVIVADYAHHPDSVKLTLEAAHELPHKRLYACFQPITYSRAKGLCEGYVDALKNEDPAILLEVYDSREKDHSFSSSCISEKINELGGNALFMQTPADLEAYLRDKLEAGDLVLLMGQDIRFVGDRLCGRTDHYAGRKSVAEEWSGQKSGKEAQGQG